MRQCVRAGWFLCVGLLMADVSMADQAAGKWHHSYARAYHEAKRLEKPLLVHFYADWCGPCQQMEASVLNTKKVTAQLGRSIIGVKINVDRYPQLVEDFRIDGFPSDVFVSSTGKIQFRSGYTSQKGFLAQIARSAKTKGAAKTKEGTAQTSVIKGKAPHGSNGRPALEGYSPVSISGERKWRKGNRRFDWEYEGLVYRMRNADELARFQADPQRYVPGWHGDDPLIHSRSGQSVPGDIRYGVFFHQRLYLLVSEENRRRFHQNPQRYAAGEDQPNSGGVDMAGMTGAE